MADPLSERLIRRVDDEQANITRLENQLVQATTPEARAATLEALRLARQSLRDTEQSIGMNYIFLCAHVCLC